MNEIKITVHLNATDLRQFIDEAKAKAEQAAAAARKIALGKAAHISFSEPLHRQPAYQMWLATVETALGMPMRLLIKVEREKKWTFRDEAEAYELKVEIAGFVPSWYEKTGHSRTDRFTCGDGLGWRDGEAQEQAPQRTLKITPPASPESDCRIQARPERMDPARLARDGQIRRGAKRWRFN